MSAYVRGTDEYNDDEYGNDDRGTFKENGDNGTGVHRVMTSKTEDRSTWKICCVISNATGTRRRTTWDQGEIGGDM